MYMNILIQVIMQTMKNIVCNSVLKELPLRKNKESAEKDLQETKTRAKRRKKQNRNHDLENSRELGCNNISCSLLTTYLKKILLLLFALFLYGHILPSFYELQIYHLPLLSLIHFKLFSHSLLHSVLTIL